MKDLKISKELIRAVLKIDIKDVSIIGSTLNYTILNHETEEDGELVYIDLGQNINIYEFAFKCQESAIDKGFDICPKMDNNGFYRLLTDDNIIGFKVEDKFTFSESISPCSSRVEAIFKAYEWILKEIKDK